MEERTAKPKGSLWPWIIATIVAVPALYALSLGPLAAIWSIWMPMPPLIDDALDVYFYPSRVVYEVGPQPVKKVMDGYVRLFVDLPPP